MHIIKDLENIKIKKRNFKSLNLKKKVNREIL